MNIVLHLSLEDTNLILKALGELPAKEVFSTLVKVKQEADAQYAEAQRMAAEKQAALEAQAISEATPVTPTLVEKES